MAKTPSRPRDANQLAKLMIDIASGEADDLGPQKNDAAAALGREGGIARAKKLSAEERSKIAKKAAAARYAKS